MGGTHLTYEEINQIKAMASRGMRPAVIARHIKRSPATVGNIMRRAKVTVSHMPMPIPPVLSEAASTDVWAIVSLISTSNLSEEAKRQTVAALMKV